MNGQNKKEFCERTRDTIKDWYVKSHSEDSQNDGGLLKYTKFAQPLVFGVRGKFTSSDKLCEQILSNKAPKTHKEIAQKYNSNQEFLRQCKYFDSVSCSSFDPEASGIVHFAKECTKYYTAVNSITDCFKTVIPASDSISKIFSTNNMLAFLIKQTASALVNIMTFGTWGGLNGGYHMVHLGLQIKNYLNSPNTDAAYRIGGIIGRAMKIILSVSGIPTVRRRRLMKFRKN